MAFLKFRLSNAKAAMTWNSQPSSQSAPVIQPGFKAGQNVRHPAYGEGMVLNSVIDDGEEIVDVFFQDVGLKKMVASLAHLEVVE